MKPIQTIFLSLLFSLLFFGCDDKLSSEETVYSGTFTVTYTNEDGTQRTRSGPVKLELRQDGKYFCIGKFRLHTGRRFRNVLVKGRGNYI